MTVDIRMLDPETKQFFADWKDYATRSESKEEWDTRIRALNLRGYPFRWSHHNLRLGDWLCDQLEARYKSAKERGEDVTNMLDGFWAGEIKLTITDSRYLYECALRDVQAMRKQLLEAYDKLGMYEKRPSDAEVLGERGSRMMGTLERFLGVLLEALYHNLDINCSM